MVQILSITNIGARNCYRDVICVIIGKVEIIVIIFITTNKNVVIIIIELVLCCCCRHPLLYIIYTTKRKKIREIFVGRSQCLFYHSCKDTWVDSVIYIFKGFVIQTVEILACLSIQQGSTSSQFSLSSSSLSYPLFRCHINILEIYMDILYVSG